MPSLTITADMRTDLGQVIQVCAGKWGFTPTPQQTLAFIIQRAKETLFREESRGHR